MSVLKTFDIALDTKKALYGSRITLVESDTGNRFVITLTDDGTAVDLTGCRVSVVFSGAMGTAMQDSWTGTGDVSISGTSHNIITIDVHSGSFATGLNTCEIQVYSGATYTTLITSARFTFNAQKPILDDETIVSTDSYPTLVYWADKLEALTEREQADWTEADNTKGTYIQNKPVAGTNFQDATQNLTAETTLSDADTVPFYDASATAHRKSTWANIVATITALFRSIFMPYDSTSTNLLINGGFDIWQRGTSFTATDYTADRWKMTLGASQAITATRQAFTAGQTDVPKNPAYYARLAISNAGSGSGAFEQRIENVSTGAGEAVAYSFYAKCDATTYAAQVQMVQNFGSGGSTDVAATAQNITLTTSWQKFEGTFSLASVSGKTIGANNYLSLRIILPTASGTKTISIANVQLNYGTVALPYVPRSLAEEFRLCKRYYRKSYDPDTAPGTATEVGMHLTNTIALAITNGNRFAIGCHPRFDAEMRINPTVTFYRPDTGATGSWFFGGNYYAVSAESGKSGFFVLNNSGGTVTPAASWVLGHWAADAEL